eukprot:Nk52_evm8s2241 gene=Nk52_evmTU8s2241
MAAFENIKEHTLGKLAFAKHLPLLMKATSDSSEPASGYLLKEVCDMTFESLYICGEVHNYLVKRLEGNRKYWIKLKVLKLMHHLTKHGHPSFRKELAKNTGGVSECVNFSGAPDPLHGNAPYVKIQKIANDILEMLFQSPPQDQGEESPLHGKMVSFGGISGAKMEGFGNTASSSSGARRGGSSGTSKVRKSSGQVVNSLLEAVSSIPTNLDHFLGEDVWNDSGSGQRSEEDSNLSDSFSPGNFESRLVSELTSSMGMVATLRKEDIANFMIKYQNGDKQNVYSALLKRLEIDVPWKTQSKALILLDALLNHHLSSSSKGEFASLMNLKAYLENLEDLERLSSHSGVREKSSAVKALLENHIQPLLNLEDDLSASKDFTKCTFHQPPSAKEASYGLFAGMKLHYFETPAESPAAEISTKSKFAFI